MMRLRYVAIAVLSMAATPATAAEMLPIRTVSVSGMAERKIVPDEAHINVNLNAMDKKMATAKSAHDTKLEKLLDIVKAAGIDEKKVRSESSSIQPVYRYENDAKGKNTRIFEGYRVQTTLDVTVGDTKKLGSLMEKISSAGFEEGANTEWGNLMSVYYSISNPNKIREDMLSEAMANAKLKAARLATATGSNLGRVYQINEGESPRFAPMPMMAMASGVAVARADKAEMAPPAGEQQLSASINVVYELKD